MRRLRCTCGKRQASMYSSRFSKFSIHCPACNRDLEIALLIGHGDDGYKAHWDAAIEKLIACWKFGDRGDLAAPELK